MYLMLSTYTEISLYQVGLIAKYAFNITLIVLPIIVIITTMVDIGKLVLNPDKPTNQLTAFIKRIIAGLTVFMIPTIVNYAFTLVEDFDPNTFIKYYNDASIEKIKSLKVQYEQEQAAEKAKNQAEIKQATLAKAEEERKRQEQIEQARKEEEQQNQNNSGGTGESNGGSGGNSNGGSNGNSTGGGSYAGDSSSGGEYGLLRVENGVFYLPNRRATSEADIPKQSGQYGLNPIFWERLSALISDAKAQGYSVKVTSGWRSYGSQRSLWDNSNRPCNQRGKWVACPGGSRHGFGIAADLSFNGSSCSGGWDCNAAARWVHANAGNYGLKFRMSWEPWHIEPANVQGGSFGSCNASC